jgi:hypothetical protein
MLVFQSIRKSLKELRLRGIVHKQTDCDCECYTLILNVGVTEDRYIHLASSSESSLYSFEICEWDGNEEVRIRIRKRAEILIRWREQKMTRHLLRKGRRSHNNISSASSSQTSLAAPTAPTFTFRYICQYFPHFEINIRYIFIPVPHISTNRCFNVIC